MKRVDNFMKGEQILRYPRLDTILMVERFIRKHDGEFKKRRLWESLPKKMMYQTFQVIIKYLAYSKKISIDSQQKIGWIYYPQHAKRYHERKSLGRKSETSIESKVRRQKPSKNILWIRKRR